MGALVARFPAREIRYAVVLFDYDPAEHSPNDDGADDELALFKNERLKIIGDIDESGENYFGSLTVPKPYAQSCQLIVNQAFSLANI